MSQSAITVDQVTVTYRNGHTAPTGRYFSGAWWFNRRPGRRKWFR